MTEVKYSRINWPKFTGTDECAVHINFKSLHTLSNFDFWTARLHVQYKIISIQKLLLES